MIEYVAMYSKQGYHIWYENNIAATAEGTGCFFVVVILDTPNNITQHTSKRQISF